MNIFILKIAIAALAILALTNVVLADDLDDILQVKLLPGWRGGDGTHIAAIQISLAPGWKTYWRQPGDTGIPPKFDFTGSSNLDVLEVLYPTPNIIWQDGSRSIGYEAEVVFPIIVQPRNKNKVKLVGQIEIGVCKEICIPVSLIVSERLAVGAHKDTVIEAAIQTLPKLGMEKILCASLESNIKLFSAFFAKTKSNKFSALRAKAKCQIFLGRQMSNNFLRAFGATCQQILQRLRRKKCNANILNLFFLGWGCSIVPEPL